MCIFTPAFTRNSSTNMGVSGHMGLTRAWILPHEEDCGKGKGVEGGCERVRLMTHGTPAGQRGREEVRGGVDTGKTADRVNGLTRGPRGTEDFGGRVLEKVRWKGRKQLSGRPVCS